MRTFSLGAGANVVKYSGTGETASVGSSNVAVANIVATVKAAQGADTINNVKAGDKITLAPAGNITQLVAYNSGNVVDSSKVSSISDLKADGSGDVFVLKDGTDYFLVYEANGSGDTTNLGSGAEIIKLVGFTDSNTISVDSDNKTIIIG